MNAIAYPRLIKRIRAVLIDSVLLPITLFSALIMGDALGVSHPYAKAALFAGPIFILEPGLVAFTGGTVGHHLLGIRVVRVGDTRNLNIFAATLRFVVKLLLGWLSFVFVLATAKHQAAHDVVARSRVIYKNAVGLPAHEILSERKLDETAYVYPPAWRRVIVIAAYFLLSLVLLSVVLATFSSGECLRLSQCGTSDVIVKYVSSISWVVGLGWVTVRGWTGTLFGCRRRKRESAE